jgi:hypothetical protein
MRSAGFEPAIPVDQFWVHGERDFAYLSSINIFTQI